MGLEGITWVGPLWLNGLLCLIGFGYHAMTKWDEYNTQVKPVSLPGYVKAVPARVAMSVFASALAFLGTWALGWLNPGMAIASGYMANSVINQMANKRDAANGGKDQ